MSGLLDASPIATPIDAPARKSRGPYRLARPIWCVPVLLFLAVFFVIPLIANITRSAPPGAAATQGAFSTIKNCSPTRITPTSSGSPSRSAL